MGNPLTKTAVRFRAALMVCYALLLALIVVGCVYGVKLLASEAKRVNEVAVTADTQSQKLDQIRAESKILDERRNTVETAKKITAESKSYNYQDTIVRDIRSIADRAGIKITAYDFAGSEGTSSAGGTQTPSSTSPSAPSSTLTPPAASSAGLRSTTVNITFESPVDYDKFIRFLSLIEENVTRMQVATVSLSGDKNEITSDALTIEVYVQ